MPPRAARTGRQAALQDCANPLFLEWLEELRDQARERGLKIADVYQKACRSVAACPVKYDRPRDLAVLQGVGPKTVQLLEKKLEKYCKDTGMPMPPSPPPKRRARQPSEAANDGEDAPAAGVPDAPAAKKKRTARPAAYVPRQGSGPYGLLLGLLAAVDDPVENLQVFLTKGELVRHAQPFCTSSYEHSEKGTFATAWNGMKTLIGKGYVYVQGSPQRFCLTEDGHDVAVTLRNMHPDFADQPALPRLGGRDSMPPAAGPSRQASVGPSGPASLGPARHPSAASSAPPRARSSSGSKFAFWYISPSGERVKDLASAHLILDPTDFVPARKVEFRASQRTHPIVQHLRKVEPHATCKTSLLGFILEESAPPQCSCFDDGESDGGAPGIVSAASSLSVTQSLTATRSAGTIEASTSLAVATTSVLITAQGRSLGSTASAPDLSAPAPASAVPDRLRPAGRRAPRLSSQLPLPGDERAAPDFDPSQAIVFPYGSYEVILVLDSREVESKTNRDKISRALATKGVKVETRALRLGDICWIARRVDAMGGEEDECVLDYVVERKRLDDLCFSIRDGRYNDQCFRLTNSAIGNVFYIVEDFQLNERMEFHGKQIMTAKSQIQVVNGFFLKETHRLADTIEYLATLTGVIARAHRDLHVIPSRFLSRTSYMALQKTLRAARAATPFLTSFDAYQALNDKSGSRTLREGLARMLLCVKGMSPERVAGLLDYFETPRELYDAMLAREAQGPLGEGRRTRLPAHMFADMGGAGRRSIGDAQSLLVSGAAGVR